MGQRQIEWARKTRDKIFDKLGRKCKKCGATEELEFDVIVPIGDNDGNGKSKHHRVMNFSWRMSFYRKQLELNNLQILCTKCNSKKQNQLELTSAPEVEQPY